jgi:(2Fe-2S) ferredoxin
MTGTDTAAELDFHASGFIVKVQGSWTDGALQQFSRFLNLRRIFPSDDDLLGALQGAKARYLAGAAHLFVCTAEPCRGKISFDVSDAGLARACQQTGVAISITGCQGPCKQAPVVSLRISERSEVLAEVVSPNDWRAILDFAKRAGAANTLLIDSGAAEQFRFDPVHDHGKPSARLKSLEFLLGHFRGEGRYAMTDYNFQKEVIGSFEAGSRFIALRMDASYPLADGRKDVHKALVIVGSETSSGEITAHAYTDGGIVRRYEVRNDQGVLCFSDHPPGHTGQWKRARKLLNPTIEGFEERLEVDGGDGRFVPYYVVCMRRVGA